MSVIALGEKYYRDVLALSEYAFQFKFDDEEVEEVIDDMKKHHLLYGICVEDQLAAKLHLLPLEVSFGDQRFKMGGIAGVATYPQYRRNGYIRKLLKHVLLTMKNDGYTVSMLHPFSVSFYRKFGYELFSNRLMCTINKSNLVMQKQVKGRVKLYRKDTHPAEINEVYHQYAKKFAGMLVRNEERWKSVYYDNLTAAVYYNEQNEATGYILYRIKDSIMSIREFITLNHEARQGLWNFSCQHDSMINELKIILNEKDPLLHTLREPRITAELRPYFMARIVDVKAFLDQYSFAWENQTSVVCLHVTDEVAAWNNMTFVLDNGHVHIKKEVDAIAAQDKGLCVDIHALTAMLFGYKRPIELYELEQLSGPKEQVEALEQLIPSYQPFFSDFF